MHLGERPEVTLEELWEKMDGFEEVMREVVGMVRERWLGPGERKWADEHGRRTGKSEEAGEGNEGG